MPRSSLLLALLLASCAEGPEIDPPLDDGLRDTGLVDVDDGSPPEVTVSEELVALGGLDYRLSGTASHPAQAADTLVVTVESDLSGLLWEGRPGRDGRWAWEGALEAGAQEITVIVVDRLGHSAAAGLVIDPQWVNRAPLCGIDSPLDGSVHDRTTPIAFVAAWEEPDGDPLSLMWRSDLYGPIFMGESWEVRLPAGVHVITLSGDDGQGGRCADEAVITVTGGSL